MPEVRAESASGTASQRGRSAGQGCREEGRTLGRGRGRVASGLTGTGLSTNGNPRGRLPWGRASNPRLEPGRLWMKPRGPRCHTDPYSTQRDLLKPASWANMSRPQTISPLISALQGYGAVGPSVLFSFQLSAEAQLLHPSAPPLRQPL